MARCTRAGVVVPRVLWVDDKNGVIGMEKVEGWSVREVLGGGAEGEGVDDDQEEEEEADEEIKNGDQALDGRPANQSHMVSEENPTALSEGWLALRDRGVSKGKFNAPSCSTGTVG